MRRASAMSQKLTRSQAYTLHYQHTRGSKMHESGLPKIPGRQNSLISSLLGKVRGTTQSKIIDGTQTYPLIRPQGPQNVLNTNIPVATTASTLPFTSSSSVYRTWSDAACQHLPQNAGTSAVAALCVKKPADQPSGGGKCDTRNGCRSEDEGRTRMRAKSAGQVETTGFRNHGYREYSAGRRNTERFNGSNTISHPPHYKGFTGLER